MPKASLLLVFHKYLMRMLQYHYIQAKVLKILSRSKKVVYKPLCLNNLHNSERS